MNEDGLEEKKKQLKNYIAGLPEHLHRQCLEPTQSCEERSIRAHSIQNRRILDQLALNGHVVMVRGQRYPLPPDIEFRQVGRRQATVFTGLCGRHDNELFEPIDKQPVALHNQEHLFLLAYRSVLREYSANINAAGRLQLPYKKAVELGLEDGNNPSLAGMAAAQMMINAYDFYIYKNVLDELYLARHCDGLEHEAMVIKEVPPILAVSSVFTYAERTINKDDPERTIFNVYPANGDLVVVFSFTKKDASYIRQHLREILAADKYYKLYLLSKLILSTSENFVLSPSHHASWSDEKRMAIRDYYIDTIKTDKVGHEDELLFLF
jgi:hypothetical protein